MKIICALFAVVIAQSARCAQLNGNNSVPSGSSFTIATGATATFNGILDGTPSAGTLNLGNLTLSLPANYINTLLPSQSGQGGNVLGTDGTNLAWVTPAGGSGWTLQTVTFSPAIGGKYIVDTNSSSMTVDLPGSPAAGDEVKFYNGVVSSFGIGSWAGEPFSVNPNGHGIIMINGSVGAQTFTGPGGELVTFIYDGVNWIGIDNTVANIVSGHIDGVDIGDTVQSAGNFSSLTTTAGGGGATLSGGPTVGSGPNVDIGFYSSSHGFVQSYDGGTSLFVPLWVDGDLINFNTQSLGPSYFGGTVRLAIYVVSALPVSPGAGDMADVSDANTPVAGTPVAGGGSSFAFVIFDGTNWIVH